MIGAFAGELGELVRAGGFGEDGGAAPVVGPALVARAAGEGLAPLLGARVAAGQLATSDGAVRELLVRAYQECWAANLVIGETAAPLIARLRERAIPVLLLKGAALLRRVYRDLGCRPMADLDLLVPAAQWREALAVARVAGAREGTVGGRKLTMGFYHEAHLQLKGRGVVDLHRSLTAWPLFAVDHEALFRRALATGLGGALTPDLVDLFVSLAVHAAQDGFFLPLRAVVDGLALLATGAVSPADVVTRAREWHACRATATWLRVLVDAGLSGEIWDAAAQELAGQRWAPWGACEPRVGTQHHAEWSIWQMRWGLARSLDGPIRPIVFFAWRGALRLGDAAVATLGRAGAKRPQAPSRPSSLAPRKEGGGEVAERSA